MKGTTYREEEISEYAAQMLLRFDVWSVRQGKLDFSRRRSERRKITEEIEREGEREKQNLSSLFSVLSPLSVSVIQKLS